MKLKTLTTAIIATAMLSTTASADFFNTKAMKAAHISVSGGTSTLDGESTGVMVYGFGLEYKFKTITLGYDVSIEQVSDSESPSFTGIEVDLGYRINDRTEAFLLAGYDTDDVFSGVSYGLGAKYQLVDYVAVVAKYKASSVSAAVGPSYDRNAITAGIEFNFSTTK